MFRRSPHSRFSSAVLSVVGTFSVLALVAAIGCRLASFWYFRRFGDTGFDSILFTVLFQIEGAESGQFADFLLHAVLPAAVFAVAVFAVFAGRCRRQLFLSSVRSGRRIRVWPFPAGFRIGLSLVAGAFLFRAASRETGFGRWLSDRSERSTFIRDRYVAPLDAGIAFPGKKRNLVCIYVESAETTFFSKEQGGAMETCVVPELHALAAENVSFSHDGGIGGWPATPGTSWTVGAMVALTMGVPFKVPVHGNEYGNYSKFLPGAAALGDVLHAAGYRQGILMGSDPSFGGRDKLYGQHGTEEIFDPATAVRDGIVPEGYHKWWGFEDEVLFRYARKILSDMSSEGGPFALTILTVDTHASGGFVCDLCENRFPERYENVFACTSRQVGGFVDWMRTQPFWNDTTVFVCGDHLSMDHAFFRRVLAGNPYQRHVFNCFLNAVPPAPPERTRNRAFSPMDMFPTVLAAMGCSIPGERLGLGVNLFSGKPTLDEELGVKRYHDELRKQSDFYRYKLILGR